MSLISEIWPFFVLKLPNKEVVKIQPEVIRGTYSRLGAGDAFFAGMIICDLIKSLNETEKSIISHVFGGIHSNVFGNENFLTKDKIITTLRYILK